MARNLSKRLANQLVAKDVDTAEMRCPYCKNDLMHHSELCGGEIGYAEPIPELHPVAEFLESIPLCVRIIALALIGLGLGYGVSVIGSMI